MNEATFTEKINLRGTTYDEPWLKVQTQEGQIGWVYGGGVKFYAPKIDQAASPYDDCYVLRKKRRGDAVSPCMEKVKQQQLKKHQRWATENDREVKAALARWYLQNLSATS